MAKGKSFRPGGPPRVGRLFHADLVTIFDAVLIRGSLFNAGELREFASVVRCFDGYNGGPMRIIWTDDGAVKVDQADIEKHIAQPSPRH